MAIKQKIQSTLSPPPRRILLVVFLFIVLFVSRAETGYSKADTLGFFGYSFRYTGSSTTVNPNYRYVVDSLVAYLNRNPKTTIHIRGHVCCGAGMRISQKRARKVYRLLKQKDINKNRMTFKGYSNTVPLRFPEKTKEDQTLNRRVDIVIIEH